MRPRGLSAGILDLSVLAAVATLAVSSLTRFDFWWYLKAGELIVEGRAVPVTDPFSYTAQGRPWINHMWATQVLFALLWAHLGRLSLLALKTAVVTATFGVVLATMRRRGVHPLPAAALTLLAAWTGLPFWHVRPQIFSCLLLVIYLWLFRRGWERHPRRLALVPLLMVAWANLHAGFVVGLALIPLVGGATALPRLRHPARRRDGWRVLALTLGLATASGLACLVNPFGLEAVRFPLHVASTRAFTGQTLEWLSPSFHDPAYRAFEVMLLLLVPACAWGRRRLSGTDLVLLGTFGHLALLSARHVPLFAVVAAAPLADALQAAGRTLWTRRGRPARLLERVRGWLPTLWPWVGSPRVHAAAAALGVGVLVTAYWAVFLGSPADPLRLDLNEARYPARTMSFIKEERLPAPLFNLYAWGGYELWRLYPDYRVFIDGRTHVYGGDLLGEYLEVASLRPRWRSILDRWGVQTVVLPPRSALAEGLRAAGGWRLVFAEREAAVFVRDVDANRDLLARLAREPDPGAPPES